MNNRKKNNVSLIPKVIVILTLGFGLKLFFSCRPYSRDPIEINYNNMSVVGVDNSGRYLSYNSTTDTMYSDAIALKISLSDTLMFYAVSFFPNFLQAFSFKTAQADDIAPSYIPTNKVVNIKVKTLLDINESIKAGDDISEQILCSSTNFFDMYHNLNQGISWLNGIQPYRESSSIILVLKPSVKNTTAQFEVEVTLDNGNELVGTTVMFTIIES